jgi:hypothetical protein
LLASLQRACPAREQVRKYLSKYPPGTFSYSQECENVVVVVKWILRKRKTPAYRQVNFACPPLEGARRINDITTRNLQKILF